MSRPWLVVGVLLLSMARPDGSRAAGDKTDRVLVPAGPFARGSTQGAYDERPVKVIRLRAFHIDRTEVTRAMYGRCVAARRCKPLVGDLTTEPELPRHQRQLERGACLLRLRSRTLAHRGRMGKGRPRRRRP